MKHYLYFLSIIRKVVEIIPVNKSDFSNPFDKRKVSFLPFFESIKKKFQTAELIPSLNDYVLPENAYWAAVPQLAQLFSNAQLSEITGNEKAHWASIYDVENEGAASLLSVLNISEVGEYEDVNDEEDDSNLTDAQREKIEFADKLKAMGINEEDLEDFREFKRQKEAQKRAAELERNSWDSTPRSEQKNTGIEEIDDLFDDEEDEKNPASEGKKKINKATTDVIKDITRRTRERGIALSNPKITDEDDTDEDEFMPSAVDYSKKIEQAKQKSAAEIDRITYFEELQNQALSAEKYSYRWFMTLLEMESINIGEANTKSREVSICFAKVERESGTKRTLVLKYPDQYIIYTMVHLDSFVKPETIPYQYKVELL